MRDLGPRRRKRHDPLLDFLRGQFPAVQALHGTLFTWLMTAIGAAAIFLAREPSRKLQDGMLGFAAGAMIFVGVEDAISEAQSQGNNDVALG